MNIEVLTEFVILYFIIKELKNVISLQDWTFQFYSWRKQMVDNKRGRLQPPPFFLTIGQNQDKYILNLNKHIFKSAIVIDLCFEK